MRIVGELIDFLKAILKAGLVPIFPEKVIIIVCVLNKSSGETFRRFRIRHLKTQFTFPYIKFKNKA